MLNICASAFAFSKAHREAVDSHLEEVYSHLEVAKSAECIASKYAEVARLSKIFSKYNNPNGLFLEGEKLSEFIDAIEGCIDLFETIATIFREERDPFGIGVSKIIDTYKKTRADKKPKNYTSSPSVTESIEDVVAKINEEWGKAHIEGKDFFKTWFPLGPDKKAFFKIICWIYLFGYNVYCNIFK
jgi:hypothetical protein